MNETTVTAASNIVSFSDGTSRDFKQKGQLQREICLTDTGATLSVYTVTGHLHLIDLNVNGSDFAKTLAARGAMEIISNSAAGAFKESAEEFDLAVEQAVNNIRNEVIPAREPGTGGTRGFADLIRAVVEIRTAAVAAAEEGKFAPDFASEATVRGWVLANTDEVNKGHLANPHVKAKVDGYKAQRAAEKAAKSANVGLTVSADDLAAAGLL